MGLLGKKKKKKKGIEAVTKMTSGTQKTKLKRNFKRKLTNIVSTH